MDLTPTPFRDGATPTPQRSRLTGILSNVVWIVAHLDEHGLDELRNLPILELAKHISVAPEPAEELAPR